MKTIIALLVCVCSGCATAPNSVMPPPATSATIAKPSPSEWSRRENALREKIPADVYQSLTSDEVRMLVELPSDPDVPYDHRQSVGRTNLIWKVYRGLPGTISLATDLKVKVVALSRKLQHSDPDANLIAGVIVGMLSDEIHSFGDGWCRTYMDFGWQLPASKRELERWTEEIFRTEAVKQIVIARASPASTDN